MNIFNGIALIELAELAEAKGYRVEVESNGDLWIQKGANYIQVDAGNDLWMSGGWSYDEYDFDHSMGQPFDAEKAMAWLGGDLELNRSQAW